jgi:tRNA-dihydrouridine synthase B
VRRPEDAARLIRESGCDGVMIGRGATRNPWIFRQAAALLAGGAAEPPSLAERRALVLDHFSTVVAREGENGALHKLRTFTGVYSHGLPSGERLRRQIQQLPDTPALLAAVAGFFDELAAA